MSRLLRLLALASVLTLTARAADPILKITGPEKTLTYTAEEFAALPHTEAKVLEPHEKKEHTYSGVVAHDLLPKVGMPSGESFRSKDNYTVLFSLAEFDENFSARTILLSDREDGQPTPANAAPLRLVVPGDKRAARWARQVIAIEIVAVGETLPRPAKP